MSEAIRIEQRLSNLFSGRRRSTKREPEPESAREVEQRAVERLYGERSSIVVRSAGERRDRP